MIDERDGRDPFDDLDGDDRAHYGMGLGFEEEEESLPWLESAEDYEERTGSTARFVALVLVGLVVLAALIGAIYWMQQDQGPDTDGDGSLIAAPSGDYKAPPADPQATEVEGTGDASYAASQGKEPEAKLGGTPPAATTGGVLVQLGAYSTEKLALTGWSTITSRFDFIAGLDKRISSAVVDGGTVYRLSAVTSDVASAKSVCEKLKKAGENCLVIR